MARETKRTRTPDSNPNASQPSISPEHKPKRIKINPPTKQTLKIRPPAEEPRTSPPSVKKIKIKPPAERTGVSVQAVDANANVAVQQSESSSHSKRKGIAADSDVDSEPDASPGSKLKRKKGSFRDPASKAATDSLRSTRVGNGGGDGGRSQQGSGNATSAAAATSTSDVSHVYGSLYDFPDYSRPTPAIAPRPGINDRSKPGGFDPLVLQLLGCLQAEEGQPSQLQNVEPGSNPQQSTETGEYSFLSAMAYQLLFMLYKEPGY